MSVVLRGKEGVDVELQVSLAIPAIVVIVVEVDSVEGEGEVEPQVERGFDVVPAVVSKVEVEIAFAFVEEA
jgi:hypothetical protein